MTKWSVPKPRGIVVASVLIEGGLGLLAWLLGWLAGRPAGATLHLGPRPAALGALAAGPLMVVFVWSERSRLAPLARIRAFFDEVLLPLFSGCTLPDLALIALAAGVGEELLFRGVVQAWLDRWLGIWPGLALANLLFGLLHPITPAYVVLAALMGAYLGAVWLATDDLVAPIVAHALYDFFALVYLLRKRAHQPPAAADVERPAS